MISMFSQMVLGHFVGDFLAQPRWMAVGKSKPGWEGVAICALHVLIYTLCVCTFMGIWNIWVFFAIAVPHFIVDRHSLAKVHMRLLGVCVDDSPKYPETVVRVIQYVVIDTSIHLLFLYGLFKRLPLFLGL